MKAKPPPKVFHKRDQFQEPVTAIENYARIEFLEKSVDWLDELIALRFDDGV